MIGKKLHGEPPFAPIFQTPSDDVKSVIFVKTAVSLSFLC